MYQLILLARCLSGPPPDLQGVLQDSEHRCRHIRNDCVVQVSSSFWMTSPLAPTYISSGHGYPPHMSDHVQVCGHVTCHMSRQLILEINLVACLLKCCHARARPCCWLHWLPCLQHVGLPGLDEGPVALQGPVCLVLDNSCARPILTLCGRRRGCTAHNLYHRHWWAARVTARHTAQMHT